MFEGSESLVHQSLLKIMPLMTLFPFTYIVRKKEENKYREG
jgi:hypothetical protein